MVAFKPVKRRLWRRLAFGVGLLCLFALSSVTPIFSSVIGGVLTLIGDYYGAPASPSTPNAYIILGGGLTRLEGHITLNAYSEQRLKTLAMRWQMTPLPVVLSGVESPWLNERWYALHKYNPDKAKPLQLFADNASMNTCENARFSHKLITHESAIGALPAIDHVYLVSDWYHMARARRQFARVGLATTPIVAPMPTPRAWRDIHSNLNHSRRALYELVALGRDIVRPQPDCRSAASMDIAIIKTPRRDVPTF